MLKNYLTTAFREIFKNKTFSIIHIFGLTLGIAAFVLILQYSIGVWMVFIAMILVGPIVSGLYPALVISSFKPMTIFQGKLNGGSGGTFIRKTLVVLLK